MVKEGEFMIGDQIKRLRKIKKITQEDLGKLVGLSGVAIMRYEKGQREPNLETIQKIADALGVSINDLIESPPNKEVKSFADSQKYFKRGTKKPLIENGKIINETTILKEIYDIFRRVYQHYGFYEKYKMDELDFFYSDIDLSRTILSSIVSLILGEIITTNTKIEQNVNVKNTNRYLIPFGVTAESPIVDGSVTLLKYELGREDESLEYLKINTAINILKIANINRGEHEQGLDNPLLNLSNQELQELYKKIKGINYIENEEKPQK